MQGMLARDTSAYVIVCAASVLVQCRVSSLVCLSRDLSMVSSPRQGKSGVTDTAEDEADLARGGVTDLARGGVTDLAKGRAVSPILPEEAASSM